MFEHLWAHGAQRSRRCFIEKLHGCIFRAFLPFFVPFSLFFTRHGRSGGNVFSAAVAAVTWGGSIGGFQRHGKAWMRDQSSLFVFCVIVYGSYHGKLTIFQPPKKQSKWWSQRKQRRVWNTCQISWCVLNVHVTLQCRYHANFRTETPPWQGLSGLDGLYNPSRRPNVASASWWAL